MNRFDENERITVLYRACIAAVAKEFRHIPIEYILQPPHTMFDALLARQVAVHLMCGKYGVPRRRLEAILGRNRSTIAAACVTIDNRLSSSEFNDVYSSIANQADQYFKAKLQEVA